MNAQDLIPGLPDNVALDCLLRVDYDHLYLLSSVCRRWRQQLLSPDFARLRRLAGVVQSPLLAFCLVDTSEQRLIRTTIFTFNPTSGKWRRLPPIPAARPRRATYELVGAGHRIAAIELWPSDASEDIMIPDVHVFDLFAGTWRHGAASPISGHLPGLSACASDGAGRVFFAGGVDHLKRYSPIAMSYDVDDDTWVRLPDMANPRMSCKGFFHAGTFYVVGGMNDTSPPFDMELTCADLFHLSTRDWTFEPDFVPMRCFECTLVISPSTGKMYYFQLNFNQMILWAREGKEWDLVCNVALEFAPECFLMGWKEGFVLFERCREEEDCILHFLSLEEGTNRLSWKTEKLPHEFNWEYVMSSGCYLQV